MFLNRPSFRPYTYSFPVQGKKCGIRMERGTEKQFVREKMEIFSLSTKKRKFLVYPQKKENFQHIRERKFQKAGISTGFFAGTVFFMKCSSVAARICRQRVCYAPENYGLCGTEKVDPPLRRKICGRWRRYSILRRFPVQRVLK